MQSWGDKLNYTDVVKCVTNWARGLREKKATIDFQKSEERKLPAVCLVTCKLILFIAQCSKQ